MTNAHRTIARHILDALTMAATMLVVSTLLIVVAFMVTPYAQAEATAPSPLGYLAGSCALHTNESDPSKYALVCVPTYSPDGGLVEHVWDDGSGSYVDGWAYDPNTSTWTAPSAHLLYV